MENREREIEEKLDIILKRLAELEMKTKEEAEQVNYLQSSIKRAQEQVPVSNGKERLGFKSVIGILFRSLMVAAVAFSVSVLVKQYIDIQKKNTNQVEVPQNIGQQNVNHTEVQKLNLKKQISQLRILLDKEVNGENGAKGYGPRAKQIQHEIDSLTNVLFMLD